MSSYITGDPAGIYAMGHGAGLMMTPQASVPGYGLGASVSDLPGGWGTLLGGIAVGALINYGLVYGVAGMLKVPRPHRVAFWTALVQAGAGTIMTMIALKNVPATTTATT